MIYNMICSYFVIKFIFLNYINIYVYEKPHKMKYIYKNTSWIVRIEKTFELFVSLNNLLNFYLKKYF